MNEAYLFYHHCDYFILVQNWVAIGGICFCGCFAVISRA